MDIVKGKIGNALTSAASNHVVATANDIYDESIGKYQNEINNDLQSIVENGALINGLQLDIKQSDPNYLGIAYICYVNSDTMANSAIELPLATSNNAGLISHELYSKTTDFLNASPIIDGFNIVVGDTPDDIRFCYMYLDTDGTHKSNAIPIPLATGDNGGIISKDCYNYVHDIRRDTIINSSIHISEDTNGIKLEFNTRTNNTIEPVTKYIPFASNTSGGIISADLYKYLYNLQNGAILINPLEISQATNGLTLKYSSRHNNSINSANVNIPLASDTKNGVLSKEDYVALHNLIDNSSSTNSFIEYNQGHNTCDDFADIPANKHICLVDLTGIAGAEGETSKALTVVMEGTGEHDGAEVLLYCHHDGAANLGIGVPASSTNGAEYVLIPNDGDEYIRVGTQELDFILSCTYINNKWYVRKA